MRIMRERHPWVSGTLLVCLAEGLLLRNEGQRNRPTQGIFDDFLVLCGAKENTDRRLLVRLLHVAVKCLQVKLQFTEMLGLELDYLQLESDQAIERPVKEEQVEGEIPAADLDRVLAADEAEVAAELDEEQFELLDQGALQIRFGVLGRKVKETKRLTSSLR
jgi:hypothetical protein